MIEKYTAGCDPGMIGAICVIDSRGTLIRKYVFKKVSSGKLDLNNLNGLVWGIQDAWKPTWYLEKVHSIFRSNKGSMFKLGENMGILEGLLQANNCDWHFVTPKQWQTKIWRESDIVYKDPSAKRKTKDTKKTSLNCVERLYPGIDLKYGDNELKQSGRRTKQNEGIVDALLIARSQLNIQKDEQRIG